MRLRLAPTTSHFSNPHPIGYNPVGFKNNCIIAILACLRPTPREVSGAASAWQLGNLWRNKNNELLRSLCRQYEP